MGKKLTKQEFIKKSIAKYGETKFNYNTVVYNGMTTSIKLYCNICKQLINLTPVSHLNSITGCTLCGNKKTRNIKYTTKEFIAEAIQIHGDKYSYDSVSYRSNKNKVKIYCNTCSKMFKQSPSHHINRKHGCPYCGGTTKSDTAQFIAKAIDKHGVGVYDYSQTLYRTAKTKVCIKCIKCSSVFYQIPNNHLNGSGCPKCHKNFSRGEMLISHFLISNNIIFIKEKRFTTCKYKKPLPFDFYIESLQLLIEFDGIQHYKSSTGFFKLSRSLKEIQKCDAIKTKWAADNGYTLVRIPYTEIDRIEEILLPYIT